MSSLIVSQELADGSVHGGGGGHPAALHAGRGSASVSRRSFLRGHGEDERPAGHDEDGQSDAPLVRCVHCLLGVNEVMNVLCL